NGEFIVGDMNVFGRVYLSTAGRGIAYGEPVDGAGSSSAASSSADSSSSDSSSADSSSSSSSVVSSSSVSSSVGGQQCNWYGVLYPLCVATQTGWGWEDNSSCIAVSTCSAQPAPYGVTDGGASSSVGSSATSSSQASSSEASSVSSQPNSSSSLPSSSVSSSDTGAAGACEYLISSEWGNGFTGAIRITNNGTTAINGWAVSWSYS